MDELKDKAKGYIKKYCEEEGLEDVGATGLDEQFLNTWGDEYKEAGDEFLGAWLNTKFYEGY